MFLKAKISPPFLLLLLTLLASPLAQAQKSEEEPIELLHAGSLEFNNDPENTIIVLTDSVLLRQGEATLKGDRAVWYKTAGQVVVQGNAELQDEEQILTCDRLTYIKRIKKAMARGNVVAVDPEEETIITSGYAEYDRKKKLVVATISPHAVFKADSPESLTVDALRMEYYTGEKRAVAVDSVTIQRGKLSANCGHAELFAEEDRIVLSQSPVARQEDNELTGERMEIVIEEEEVRQVIVTGNPRATRWEPTDSARTDFAESYLTGQRIDFFLEDEEVEKVQALGNARSFYQPAPKDSSKTGKNEVSGDTLNLYLSEGKAQKVEVIGGSRGTYFAPKERAVSDTLQAQPLDTVYYSASEILYTFDDSTISLKTNSQLKHKQMSLTADLITYNTAARLLQAQGSLEEQEGERVVKNPPVLREGEDEIVGLEMVYNIETKRGKIKAGDTEFEGGFYHGEQISKITDEILFVKEGEFTSCDLNEPHFHFYGKRMKVIHRDKVIARPVIMYIGDLPVAAIPYYVFPIKRGRQSGFTTFELGNFEVGERFIRNLGYYWAASEYWDLQGSMDFYEKSHLSFNLDGRYAVRYKLAGSVSGSYVYESRWQDLQRRKGKRWSLRLAHSQDLTPTMKLSGSGNFISDKSYYEDVSYNPEEIRNRSLHSQLSLSKRWEGANLTLALDQSWNLDTETRTQKLPSVTFTKLQRPLIPYREPTKKDEERPKRWYHSIYYSLSSSGVNYFSKRKSGDIFLWRKYQVADHNLRISSPQSLGNYLTLTPNLTYQETWYYILPTNDSEDYDLKTEEFIRRGSYRFSLAAKTDLYGTFSMKLGPLRALRHVMTPSVSYSWQPEYKKGSEYKTYTGKGVSTSKVKRLSLSLANLFQMKTETGGQERKTDLFSANFSTSYDYLAPARKWGDLRSSVRSRALPNIEITIGATHSFYPKEGDELRLLEPRLLSFSASTTISLRGRGETELRGREEELPVAGAEAIFGPERERGDVKGLSWNLRLSHRYSESRAGASKSITRWFDLSGELSPTTNWRVAYTSRYNVEAKRIVEQQFQVHRDLHCWEFSFFWIPTGVRRGYYIRINIRAIPEVKIEKSEGGIKGGHLR
jgi:lipopolysaccharide assembly outer membrane protein LptD (OstA)